MIEHKFATGVVIGKFYPPHLGHHHLIRTALSQAKTVFVLVCHKPEQSIPGELRAQWLQLVHPKALIRLVDDTLGNEDTQAWAQFTLEFLGLVPDAVFTSEAYGEPYARAMGCRHVSVDPARISVPCSATKIRHDPLRHLAFLAPTTRAWFVPRICLVGAESTGKTTLARALAAHFDCDWMPEYGREYCVGKYGTQPFADGQTTDTSQWESREFIEIALEHARREDDLAGQATRLLIVDTDAFATGLWHERYLGYPSPAVETLAAKRRDRYTLYILCETDIPWVQDGTRDGEHHRLAMQERFRQELDRTKRPWVAVAGSPSARLTASVAAIHQAMATWKPFGLGMPIAQSDGFL